MQALTVHDLLTIQNNTKLYSKIDNSMDAAIKSLKVQYPSSQPQDKASKYVTMLFYSLIYSIIPAIYLNQAKTITISILDKINFN